MMMETEEPAEPVAVDSPSGEEKSVTIMIDENQKMFYDQHVLQSIIDSNQPSTQVTIVRLGGVNEAGEAGHPADLGDPTLEDTAEFVPSDMETLDLTQGGPGGGAAGSGDAQTLRDLLAHATLVETHQDPTLPPASNSITLDQEQISQLESVLQSTEAKDMLGHVMLSDEHGPLDHILTSELTPDLTASTNPLEFNVSPERPASPVNEPRPTTSETVQGRPKRRSQRRMDKEIKEEAERIRMENQALLKKEKEAWAQPHESPSTAVVKSDSVGSIPSSEVVSSPVTPIQTSVATGRPKRQRKVPAHLQGDFVTIDVSRSTAKITPVKKDDVSEPLPVSLPVEGIVDVQDEFQDEAKPEAKVQSLVESGAEEDDDEDDDEDDEGDGWNSEDDPERLWCVCQQPHNNRFMICCDQCLDWFHGKCVGITKKMGKNMEENGREWRCEKCKTDEEKAREEKQRIELAQKLKEREEARKQALIEKKDDDIEKKSPLKRTDSGKAVANISSKMPEFEKKPKGKVCFECDQTPLEHSLYCSDKCIEAHVERAKKAFACKTNNEASTTNQIIVMNPKSNQMFSGPSAPTIKTLSEWMRKHTEFHVVIPKSMPTSKFYGSQKKQSHAHAEKSKRGPKIIPPHDKATKNSDEVNQKLAEYKSMALSSLSAARETLQASLKDSNRKSESKREAQDAKRALEARRRSNEHNTVVSKRHHDPTVRKTASNVPKGEVVTPAKPKDVKALRENACKGLLDALKGRLERSKDVRMDEEKLKELVNAIEKELYDIFNKDVGLKYKNQYRRLVFNIKDPKNIGLFRKIVTGKIGPKRLVDMSPEEMASKELQQWREAELKHDIEKIKSHELEMMAMGNKLVVKSHKGEQIIETDGSVNVNDVKMPEEERILETAKETSHEMNVSTTNSGEKDGSRNHKSESSSRKDKEGSSSHHHHHHHHHRRSSSSRDKDKATSSSSSKGKDKSTTSSSSLSKEKDKSTSSKEKGKSSSSSSSSRDKDKSSSSRNKDRSSSSSSKDKSSSSSSKEYKSSDSSDKERHRHHSHKHGSKSSTEKSKERSSSGRDSTAISTSSSMVKIQPEEKASNNDEKSVDKIMQKIRSAKQKEEAQRQKEFSEKVAKAEKAIFEFNQTMASGGDGLDGLGTRTESVRPVETGSPTQLSSPPQEVSSTVHIKTPEIIVSESDEGSASLSPSSNPVWHGLVNMPDVANFNIKAFGLSGVSDFLRQDLDKEVLKVVGRIPPDTVWKYIVDLAEVPSKEILLIRLEAASEVEQQGYDSFFFYLKKKARLGVIGNCSKMVKDCYIIPVESEMDLPDCLRPLDPPGFEAVRGNILLALIVRTVRTRPDGSSGFRRSALKVGSKTMTPSISSGKDGKQAHKATIHVSAKKKRKVEVRVIDVDDGDEDEGEEEEYDPAKAGNMDMFTDQASEEDEEDYDPEKAFPSEDHEAQERDEPPQKKTKITTNEDSAFSPPHSPNDVFAAKLKKLAAEIAREKAEIASLAGQGDPTVIQADKRKPLIESSGPAFGLDASAKAAPGFQGLPSTISSILFGGGANESHSNSRDPRKKEAPPSSTLSSMTDADLLAKVQEMETNPTKSLPKSQVPPYPGTSLSTQGPHFSGITMPPVPPYPVASGIHTQHPLPNMGGGGSSWHPNGAPHLLTQHHHQPQQQQQQQQHQNHQQPQQQGPWMHGFEPPVLQNQPWAREDDHWEGPPNEQPLWRHGEQQFDHEHQHQPHDRRRGGRRGGGRFSEDRNYPRDRRDRFHDRRDSRRGERGHHRDRGHWRRQSEDDRLNH
ncbi:death-inducer obliterator 1-like [Tigriopus californicus]|uniref:death-inducer obliterator 1-like n=1 Tax=Tigriopus californicus TaxID=6832 RepID=UPI0027DA9E8F|nr:death-inducer obliterator 1-like [Tigriopus californicus]